MPISVNPTVPVITAQGVASGVVLQPGTVINAQVLKILADNLVQIAIANLAIDVVLRKFRFKPARTCSWQCRRSAKTASGSQWSGRAPVRRAAARPRDT